MGTERVCGEIVIFWRLPDGTRCSVVPGEQRTWRLLVIRMGTHLLDEDFADPYALLARARELRLVYRPSVA